MLAGLLPAASPTLAACPVSNVGLHGLLVVLADAAFDSTDGGCSARWDLPNGTVQMSQPGFLNATWAEGVDTFDVTGVPMGTPVALTAQLVVDGSVFTLGCGGTGCTGSLSMRLMSGALVDETSYNLHMFSGSQAVHDVRNLPLTIVAGTPVQIRYQVSGRRGAGGSHGSEGIGRLSFLGAPDGATVVSCQGYSSTAVPARRTSWGAIKTIYR